ncbi:MAG: AMP-binding protein [Pontiellaceae bacterium]|nr:AMP-binding protein [Pontiellaceae bacterium]
MVELTGRTLCQIFREQVRQRAEQVALREKDFGIWQRVTWRQYREQVAHFALGLKYLGFGRGERLAILSENRREWLYAELGVIALGGISVGVYPTSPYPEVQYVVHHAEARFVVCEDQEQTDKILAVWDDLPSLEKIIVVDMKGMRGYPREKIIPFSEVEKYGREMAAAEPGLFDAEVDQGRDTDVCIMIYTSGTTGKPKGAMINHRNIESMSLGSVEAIGATAADAVVSYLPLCHVAEKIFSLFLPLTVGYVVNFAENIATLQSDLREIAPTIFLGVPRIWEKLQSSIVINLKETTAFKRWLYERCQVIGRRRADVRLSGRKPGVGLWLASAVAYGLMFRALQNFIGLRNARFCFSAASKVSPEVLYFFHALGIRVKEGYGMTESSGLSFIHQGEDIRLGTVGRPLSVIEYRIAADGELLKKGEPIFVGYYKNPAATAEVVIDGWLHTGDIAVEDDDGQVRIVDRKKDIIITSGGKNIAPSEIENALKVSPYIKEAIVVGEGKNYLGALIQIDFENMGKWAIDRGITFTNFKNLTAHDAVYQLIEQEVEAVNRQFARVENIRRFILLAKELDHDDDEVTATMKVRRANIYKKFADEICRLYS